MCLKGRNSIKWKRIHLHNVLHTSESMMAANGKLIKLDRTPFIDLILGSVTSSQLVYMTPQVNCMYLSQQACKELHAVHPNFWAHVPVIGQVTKYFTADCKDNMGRGCHCAANLEAPEPPTRLPGGSPEKL